MKIISLMSGTSLDGLDIAYCDIFDGGTGFKLIAAETIPYSDSWIVRLSNLHNATAFEYALADVDLGHYFGKCIIDFIYRNNASPELISSHGHTIFHQPSLKLTTQIGNGAAIAAETKLPVVCDFRTVDVALGGQGAPLVPIGDTILFSQYTACLNLGGFSNISYDSPHRVAFDISPCNMALNHISNILGKPYDKDGLLAQQGQIDNDLFSRLNSLSYYAQMPPKSLGKEWFLEEFLPMLQQSSTSTINQLTTITHHIAFQIATILNSISTPSPLLLATGGGAKNCYLISLIRQYAPQWQVEVPSVEVVDYKEAIVFALLGYLRYKGMVNTLSTVTGATISSVGGSLIQPIPQN